MEQSEREIRNGVVDILCFLSSGKATESQLAEIEKRISMAADICRELMEKENVSI